MPDDDEALLTLSPPALDTADGVPAVVLIVDDQALGAQQVGRMVEKLGHRPVLVHTWTDAIQAFAAGGIDLVLMDAVMPKVDGFKLTKIFRERSSSYVPIVFLTSKADERARRRSIDVGADDLLAKPVDEVELQLRLVAMLRIRRLTQALEKRTRALVRLAQVDALTGLFNRRMFDEHLPTEIERARRYGRDLSVLMIDVDHFKSVNDSFGHGVGDRVLEALGEVLVSGLRDSDGAYRYGGEEFVVIAPETDAEGAVRCAERIREAFRRESALRSPAGSCTLSVGVATLARLPEDASAGDLAREADAALYDAKRSGRDRVLMRTED